MEVKKVNYMLEIDILRNSLQKELGVLSSVLARIFITGCPKWGFKNTGCPNPLTEKK